MATYTRAKLSEEQDDHKPWIYLHLKTSSPGALIHTAVSGTTDWDEIWLWTCFTYMTESGPSYPPSGDAHRLPPERVVVEFGGTSDPDDQIVVRPRYPGPPVLAVPGLLLNNSTEVRAYCHTAELVYVWLFGHVNQIRN